MAEELVSPRWTSGAPTGSWDIVHDALSHLDIPGAGEKTEGPATKIIFLGIEIDTVEMTLRLPKKKLENPVRAPPSSAPYGARCICVDLHHLPCSGPSWPIPTGQEGVPPHEVGVDCCIEADVVVFLVGSSNTLPRKVLPG